MIREREARIAAVKGLNKINNTVNVYCICNIIVTFQNSANLFSDIGVFKNIWESMKITSFIFCVVEWNINKLFVC